MATLKETHSKLMLKLYILRYQKRFTMATLEETHSKPMLKLFGRLLYLHSLYSCTSVVFFIFCRSW